MANNLNVGDTVYVPCSLFPEELETFETALYKTKVESKTGKSVTVRLPGGVESKAVGASRLHKDVGLLLIELGDFDSEAATLDPLAKSVLQFCRLLVPDDQTRFVKVRSLAELEMFWKKNQAAFSHVILVGHGDTDELGFAVDGSVKLAKFAETLKLRKATPKLFISLACKTGYQSFGGEFSKEAICQNFIGPFHSVHSAIASQFCQTLLTSHFLDGKTTKVAFRHARDSVPGGVSFRLWRNGSLVTDAAPKQ